MKPVLIAALVTTALLASGCGTLKPKAPSKYDLPVSGIAQLDAATADKQQQFLLCAICPHPTPKTMAIPTDEETAAILQGPSLPTPFVYTPAPAAVTDAPASAVPANPVAAPSEEAKTKYSVPFRFNSSILGKLGKKAVAEIVDAVQKLDVENYIIAIHGYTDDIGGQPANKELSLKRANTVASKLREQNIHTEIVISADGKCCFISDNSNEEKRAPNRRAEVILKRK